MPGEPFEIIFKGDPSDAVQAAKTVAAETNKIADADKKRDGIIDKINGKLSIMAKTMALAAVAATGFGIKKLKDQIDHYEKLSRAIEVSYEKAQEYAIAERDAGLATDSVREAIEGLAKAQAGYSPELRRLGFTLQEIRDLKPDELFDSLSKRLNSGELSAREFDAAVKVLGKSGGEVALALQGGFESFRQTARDSGRIIKEETFASLIGESDRFLAQVKVMADDIVGLISPFETFADGATAALKKVTDTFQKLTGGIRYVVNFYGGLLGGLSSDEAADFAATETNNADEANKKRVRDRMKQVEAQRSARENLAGEQNEGLAEILKRAEQTFSGQSDIGALQKVGLASTAGESAALRLAREQNGKLQTLIRESVKQTRALKDI